MGHPVFSDLVHTSVKNDSEQLLFSMSVPRLSTFGSKDLMLYTESFGRETPCRTLLSLLTVFSVDGSLGDTVLGGRYPV